MGERSHGDALGEGCGAGEGEREGRRGTASSSSEMMMGSTYEGIVEEEGGNGIEEWVVMEGGDILFKKLMGELKYGGRVVERIDLRRRLVGLQLWSR